VYDGFDLVILSLFGWEELYGGEFKSVLRQELLKDEQQISQVNLLKLKVSQDHTLARSVSSHCL
jgi:hypothetical protein